MKKILATTLTAFALALAGCGGGDSAPPTEDSFCAEKARRECTKVLPMCMSATFDQSSCELNRKMACVAYGTSQKMAGSSRVFKSTNMAACWSQIDAVFGQAAGAAITPAAWKNVQEACARVYEGNGTVQSTCTSTYDCLKSGNLICDKGFCAPRAAVAANMFCTTAGQVCPDTQFCKMMGTQFGCTNRVPQGGVCAPDALCDPSSYCSGGKCQPTLAAAAPCSSDEQCMSGLCHPFSATCTGPTFFLAPAGDGCTNFLSPKTNQPVSTPDAGAGDASTGG
jgi:hypothetical protein